jgi:hypothetical protein
MYVRVNQAWKNVLVAHIDNVLRFRRPVKRPDGDDSTISDFKRRRIDAVRKNNAP